VEKKTIPLAEETVQLEVRDVETGRVRVTTSTELVNEILEADLVSEAAEVTRVPIGQVVQAIPAVRNENGVTIVPVLEEVVVIQRQLVLKEELHIRISEQTSRVSVPVQLRKQHAKLDRQPSPDTIEAKDD
jgi:stress response protein YsnF